MNLPACVYVLQCADVLEGDAGRDRSQRNCRHDVPVVNEAEILDAPVRQVPAERACEAFVAHARAAEGVEAVEPLAPGRGERGERRPEAVSCEPDCPGREVRDEVFQARPFPDLVHRGAEPVVHVSAGAGRRRADVRVRQDVREDLVEVRSRPTARAGLGSPEGDHGEVVVARDETLRAAAGAEVPHALQNGLVTECLPDEVGV